MNSRTADDSYYALAILHTPGIGHANAKFLLSHFPQLADVFTAPKSKLSRVPGIGEKVIRALKSGEGKAIADRIIEATEKTDIRIIPYFSEEYPRKLRRIIDAPFVIYYQGSHSPVFDRSIGIVGTREATAYGREATERIVRDLSRLHPCIVSGLAYGIDIEAHRKAVEYRLPTVAVLAGGLDRIYPAIHRKTVDKMLTNGGILSENPPGTKPDAHLFPARNRIIAGLSDALIVVEARQKGGALITAALADSYNRPVFAVPGNLDLVSSAGCNLLIRNQKALIYTSAKDLIYHLNWSEDFHPAKEGGALSLPALSEPEKRVYETLLQTPAGISIDDLAWQSETPINQVASLLLALEFKGLVKSLPGKKFKGIS